MTKFNLRHSRWLALLLSGLIMPGLGQIYLKEKGKGYLLGGFTLLVILGGFARFMSVLFALANVKAKTQDYGFHPYRLVEEAWQLDHRIMIYFVIALAGVWILSVVDLLIPRKGPSHENT